MGMNRADAYYEPDDRVDRSDEIEERTWQLIKVGARYDYKTSSAISEALSEMSVNDCQALQDVIDTNDYGLIGKKLMMMAMEYMENLAKKEAESEIND